jgi:hypothetical protein
VAHSPRGGSRITDDKLIDFRCDTFTHESKARKVFRKGCGPAVIVMADSPVSRRWCSTSLGESQTSDAPPSYRTCTTDNPGRDPSPAAHGLASALANVVGQMGPICISREFVVFATGCTSPVVHWLRALAEHEHQRCGGPGVGAVGMCFTGGFALAMAVDVSSSDLARIKQRCADGLSVMGLRFCGDRRSPTERFNFLRDQLGDAFIAIELDDADANPDADLSPHSVLTEHLIDQAGQPTQAALHQVLDFLRARLTLDRRPTVGCDKRPPRREDLG